MRKRTGQVRRLKEKHNRLGTNIRNMHKKNAGNVPSLLAAHTYRNLVAAVAPGDGQHQSPTNGVLVETMLLINTVLIRMILTP